MPVRYLAITVLREPVSRIVSQYRAESLLPTPIGAEIRTGKISLSEYFRGLYPPRLLQHRIFAPTSGDVDEALQNIKDKMSLFGFRNAMMNSWSCLAPCSVYPISCMHRSM